MRIEDIAKIAKVSNSAVSLALNNKPGISEATRKKILEIVKETGYIPRTLVKAENLYAPAKTLQFLACTNSNIVSPHYSSSPFFMELMHGIQNQCQKSGYTLLYSTVQLETLEQEVEQLAKNNSSSGIILLGTNLSPYQIDIITSNQPNTVVLDTCFELTDANFIVMNNKKGAYDATSYLIQLGHREIGYMQSKIRILNFDSRKAGFQQSLADNSIKVLEKNIFSVSPNTELAKEEFINIIKERMDSLPSAFFCDNDYIAIGAIKAFNELGINVPNRVSIIGFDNISEATIISPELSTVHVEKEKMGSLAVQKLVENIENNDSAKIKSIIDTKLIIRNSCREIIYD